MKYYWYGINIDEVWQTSTITCPFYITFMNLCHNITLVNNLDKGWCSKNYQLHKLDAREICQILCLASFECFIRLNTYCKCTHTISMMQWILTAKKIIIGNCQHCKTAINLGFALVDSDFTGCEFSYYHILWSDIS